MRIITAQRTRRRKSVVPRIQILSIPSLQVAGEFYVKCSQDAVAVFLQHWNQADLGFREEAKVIYMKRNALVIGVFDLSCGGITTTVVDQRVIYAVALGVGAVGFIVCHNHPSGNLEPSKKDTQITNQIRKSAKLLDLEFLDHIILTKNGYYSYSDDGKL